MGVELVAAVPELVDVVANAMRLADRAEVWASSHSRPAEALARSIKRSRYTRAAISGGQPACIFGVAAWSLTGDVGSPWLLGTGRNGPAWPGSAGDVQGPDSSVGIGVSPVGELCGLPQCRVDPVAALVRVPV